MVLRKKICLLSLSPVRLDGRVLRQIKYLAPYYDLTVIGYGDPHPSWANWPQVTWRPVVKERPPQFKVLAYLLLGQIWPTAHERWYWLKPQHLKTMQFALESGCDALYANEWDSLPLAVEAAHQLHVPVVYDAHEYTVGQYQNASPIKRWLMPAAMRTLLRRYAPQVQASVTVCNPFAQKLREEFGLDPLVVMNTPEMIPNIKPARLSEDRNINIIHHGIAQRSRRLDVTIKTINLCHLRYKMDFMLLDHDEGYIQELRNLAEELTPNRVRFIEPVMPEEIVQRIAGYDIGIFILPPANDSLRLTLPNKLFEFINAGLAVCIGPSQAMAEIVHRYGCGCVAPSFEPQDVAATLNGLSIEQVNAMKQAARRAAQELNADVELSKLVLLMQKVLSS